MPEPWKFPSLNSCQKRFLWIHKGVDLAPHPVIGLVLQVGDAEKLPKALGFENLNPFLRVSKQGPCFTAMKDRQVLFSLAIAAIAEAILMRISAEQSRSLQELIWSKYDNFYCSFWIADPVASKLGLIVHYYNPESQSVLWRNWIVVFKVKVTAKFQNLY